MPVPIILAATAIAGIGLQAYGTAQAASASKKTAEANQNIAEAQQRQEALRRQQMELDARRKQIEAIRQGQRARAQATAVANNQGALYGSGLAGGYGQISGETGTNLLGLSQSLALGRANFDQSGIISTNRYNIAGYQSDLAFGQGMSSLGGGLIQSLGPIGNLAGGFGSPKGGSSYSAPSYNPYYGSGSSYGSIY